MAQPSWTRDLLTLVAEQHPFVAADVAGMLDMLALAPDTPLDDAADDVVTAALGALESAHDKLAPVLGDTTPLVPAAARFEAARTSLEALIRGFFRREQLRQSLTADDKKRFLRGMIRTRATDARMKKFFLSGELKYTPEKGDTQSFQGKGFRSLGQEAIYAAAWGLKHGPAYQTTQPVTAARDDGSATWTGDVVAPLIRDLGIFLAFTDDDIERALNAQAAKAAPPLFGKDLHLGAPELGVLPAAAPLSIASGTITGMGLAMQRTRGDTNNGDADDGNRGDGRVAVSFIGEGGSSLGEWHEAVNLAAARKLPVIVCLQNNQTALSTRQHEQSAVRTFADKAAGYGMPHLTVDGTDPEALATAFAWAAERGRAGLGSTFIEVVAMRMCGHAHHDDMLYLGADPELGFDYPAPDARGYAQPALYAAWAAKDPIVVYGQKLVADGVVTEADILAMKAEATALCDQAAARLRDAPWPDAADAGRGVHKGEPVRVHHAPDAPCALGQAIAAERAAPRPVVIEDAPAFGRGGRTYLDAVATGIGDVFARDDRAFVIGEDVGPPYGNAFMLLKSLVEPYGDRLLNAPIAEGGIIGACVGAALEGLRPIGEMQFGDFVASGFNQLVNNAAKLRYRTGQGVPMVLRMPWGGLRRAGPYHSQDTAPWFYRTPGLKMVAPSTPHDARALMQAAHDDADPVLFFEHIALYRNPAIKQDLGDAPAAIPLGKAAFRRLGDDVSIITYGAYVHKAAAVADRLEREAGLTCDVLDLRSLAPIDWRAIAQTVLRTGKVLLVGEDARTGSIVESLQSRIAEAAFEHLDAPPRVYGALDTPVPYAPSMEDAYLFGEDQLFEAALHLGRW